MDKLTKENAEHIKVLNEEMGEIKICIAEFKKDNAVEHAEMKTNISWIMKIDVATLLAIIGGAIALLLKR